MSEVVTVMDDDADDDANADDDEASDEDEDSEEDVFCDRTHSVCQQYSVYTGEGGGCDDRIAGGADSAALAGHP